MYHVRRDKRSRQSSGQIYEALSALMGEGEYGGITVTALVKRAGVGRATFYRNFDCIDDVLHLRCDLLFDDLARLMMLEKEKTTADDALEATRRLFLVFLRFWDQESELIRQLITARSYGHLMGAFEALFVRISGAEAQRLNVPGQFTEYLNAMQCGAAIGVLLRWIYNGKPTPPEIMAGFLAQTIRVARDSHLAALSHANLL